MKQSILVVAILLLIGSTVSAEMILPRSQLLPVPGLTAQQMLAQDQGFTELKDTSRIQSELKEPWRAFLWSLILPGAGEYYTDSRLKAKLFFASEVGLWSALVSFRHLGDWRKDDYQLLAATAAGADVVGKDDRFLDVLGFYESREQYNKVAGVYDPSRPYYPDTKSYFWKWESTAARLKYRDLKNDSRSYYRKANFSLGLIVANHLISAVDAYWSAKRFNGRFDSGFSGVDFRLLADGGWQLQLNLRF